MPTSEYPEDQLSTEEADALQQYFAREGQKGVKKYVSERLDKWKSTPVNIAVTGNSGTGKSSFINAMLGLTAESKGAAPVGVTETTMAPKSYKHPDNDNFRLWDLPGVGTPNFPRDGYLEKVEFKKYDFFIIMSCPRFTENDVWLGKEVGKAKKHFYFVRSKVDIDVENDKHDHPNIHSRDKVISEVRNYSYNCLKEVGLGAAPVFCISTRRACQYSDFNRLSTRLIKDASGLQKEAIVLSISVLTEGVIKAKAEICKKRIYVAAVASAAVGAIPIPGIDAAVDVNIYIKEGKFYQKQLGLDDETLANSAKILQMDIADLRTKCDLKTKELKLTVTGLKAVISILIASTKKSSSKIVFPIIGSIISSFVSYAGTVHALKQLLGLMVDDAITINKFMLSKL